MMDSAFQALSSALQCLGYTISVPDDFDIRPNFEFAADCFAWLCQRVDSEIAAVRDYTSEQKRVAFINALGSQLYCRTRIKANLFHIYQSGIVAAKELNRLARLLLDTSQQDNVSRSVASNMSQLQQKRAHYRQAAQQLSQSVIVNGQQLINTIAYAPEIIHQLDYIVASGSNLESIKQQVNAALSSSQEKMEALRQAIQDLDEEQQSLEAKVEKRHTELDRMERRLDAMHGIKPAQSEETDRLEAELAELYKIYLHRFRNLEYLEGQLNRMKDMQEAKAEEADRMMRRIQRHMQEEEARVLHGDLNGDPIACGSSTLSEDSEAEFAVFQPKALPNLAVGFKTDDSSTSTTHPTGGFKSGNGSISSSLAGRLSTTSGSLRPTSAAGKRPTSATKKLGGMVAAGMLSLDVMQSPALHERTGSLPFGEDNNF